MRRRKKLTRRAFSQTAAAAIVGTSMWPASAAHASLFGEENATLLAILAEMIDQVVQAAKTVQGVFQTVNQLISVVEQGKTMLAHLRDIDSLVGVLNWSRGAIAKLQQIDRDVTRLGYKFDLIDKQHDAVFPARQSLQSMPSKDFATTARGWNDAMRESTVVAMRAQTSVESLQARAETQRQILYSSKIADGVVGQLQAVVSGLSLLHSDLAAIETNLAAGMRVTAAWAGQQAGQADLIAEEHKRMLEGYTAVDAPDGVLTEFP